MRMRDKVGIITGAGTGIGQAGASRFAAEGASVVVVALSDEEVAGTVEAIERSGGTALGISGDVGVPEFAKEIVDKAVERFGGLDFLWNHVGYPGPAQIEDLDLAEFHKTIQLNIASGLISTSQAIPHLRTRGGGSVLFTASTSGIQASEMSPLYSTAKFGVVGLARSLAKKYGPERIRVNAVCPGAVDTPMLREFMTRADDESLRNTDTELIISQKGDRVPLRRIAQPQDVANAALFLCSEEASFITGVALPVDGGLTA